MSPELLWRLARVGHAVISPEGDEVAYPVTRFQLSENSGATEIRLVSIDGTNERVLFEGLASVGDLQWAKTPRGTKLFFAGSVDAESKPQVYELDPTTAELVQATSIENGVGHLRVAPTGDRIAFTTRVKIDPDVHDLYPDLPHADARIIDSLMFRHWNRWRDGTYSHLHVGKLGSDGRLESALDLMKGRRFECPVPPFGGSEQFAWSPDGKEIALTAKVVGEDEWARSTDTDIYLVPADGSERLLCITVGMNGYDMAPAYSPDGRVIAFHSMERPGFEADRNRIFLFDRTSRKLEEVTEGLDLSAEELCWAPDSASLFFAADVRGARQIYSLDLAARTTKALTSGRFNWGFHDVAPDGESILVGQMSMVRPTELLSMRLSDGSTTPLSDINGEIYASLELPRIEERWVRSTDGQKVHNWVIYPPDFDPDRTWPLLVYCQGGPQQQIGQWFSYRWNFHLMASKGYVVLAVNRRGLPGFGREWNDQISRDWGGQAMQDILASTDSMMTESYIDTRRMAAIGASFGGYTTYWLMGNDGGRFAAMVSHCGVFNLESMYGSTEELFFVDWDLGGPYWKSADTQELYDRFSPHRFVGRWRTPILIIHGEKDFRVPVTQGIEAFTAARVEGVPARFLYYPAEGHWVLSPQNGVLWHRVFFDWLERWVGEEKSEKNRTSSPAETEVSASRDVSE
ncbi:MAG TPA: S9 family peptidase [Planctomycetota bacterium]|nr:S9 family peptidase [Planctomycetota bacterium]